MNIDKAKSRMKLSMELSRYSTDNLWKVCIKYAQWISIKFIKMTRKMVQIDFIDCISFKENCLQMFKRNVDNSSYNILLPLSITFFVKQQHINAHNICEKYKTTNKPFK